jgi:hypothetical protein
MDGRVSFLPDHMKSVMMQGRKAPFNRRYFFFMKVMVVAIGVIATKK